MGNELAVRIVGSPFPFDLLHLESIKEKKVHNAVYMTCDLFLIAKLKETLKINCLLCGKTLVCEA